MKIYDKDEIREIFSVNVIGILGATGWSLRELARRTEIDPMKMSRLLRGMGALRLYEAKNIANALDMQLDKLITKRLTKKELKSAAVSKRLHLTR